MFKNLWFMRKTPRPGERYVLNHDNPFEDAPVVEVVDVKGKWIQYSFVHGGVVSPNKHSNKVGNFLSVYKKVDDTNQ